MEIKPNPLAADPDNCYRAEERNGRYKSLRKIENRIDVEKKPNSIRFVCLSDTHNKAHKLIESLPDGDVLLHGGDFTEYSRKQEIIKFNEFLGQVKEKYKHIVVIAGNHEISFDKSWDEGGCNYSKSRITFGTKSGDELNSRQAKELLTNCTYIEDETIELFGIKIYGSPWSPEFCDMGFNEPRGTPILKVWNKIPEDTDILITHGPPLGIGDKCFQGNRVGCADLLSTVMDRVKPKYHLYGHIHEGYGIWDDGTTVFINGSTVNQRSAPVHQPVVFDFVIPESK